MASLCAKQMVLISFYHLNIAGCLSKRKAYNKASKGEVTGTQGYPPPLPAMPLSENSWEEFLKTALSCKKLSVIKGSLLFSFFSFLFFFQSSSWMDAVLYSKNILCRRKGLELLPFHYYRSVKIMRVCLKYTT